MPDRSRLLPGWKPLPAIFFDPTISDADLQDQWTSGAEDAYRRLLEQLAAVALDAGAQPTAARWRVVADLYDKAAKARAFLDEAQKNAARYRQAETTVASPAHVPHGVLSCEEVSDTEPWRSEQLSERMDRMLRMVDDAGGSEQPPALPPPTRR